MQKAYVHILVGALVTGFGATLAADAPRIHFDNPIFDFGRIPSGAVVKHEFVFTNTGNAALQITDVRPHCGCTVAGAWDQSVEPGKIGIIPLQFNSAGFDGMVEKSATVTCNDPANREITLGLTGTIWNPIQVSPSMAVFNVRSDAQASETKLLRISNKTDSPVTLSELLCTNKEFEVTLKTVTPGREFELAVTSHPPFQIGTLVAPITLKTSCDQLPLLQTSAYLIVQPPVSAMPGQLIVTAEALATGSTNVITVRSQSTNRFQLSDARSNLPGAQVRISEVKAGEVASLVVTLPAGLPFEHGKAFQVTAQTGVASYPTVTIPIIQYGVAPVAAAAPVAEQKVVPQKRAVPVRHSNQ
jgi:hypothetical protein